MSAQYHNGHWYGGGQNIDIQSDPTATSFDPNKVPTGATAQSILDSNFVVREQTVSISFSAQYYKNVAYTPTAVSGYTCIGVLGWFVGNIDYFPIRITNENIYLVTYNHANKTETLTVTLQLLYKRN